MVYYEDCGALGISSLTSDLQNFVELSLFLPSHSEQAYLGRTSLVGKQAAAVQSFERTFLSLGERLSCADFGLKMRIFLNERD